MLLPGLGRVQRGAETAFLEIARGLASFPDLHVELFGTGTQGPPGIPLHQIGYVRREFFERWPKLPTLRTGDYYEEFTFVWSLYWSKRYQPRQFDVAIACTYPWVNWYLQHSGRRGGPLQIFVTQNGDWMCRAQNREFKYFRCDGLVCINPEYYERHRERYPTQLIPNGVDPTIFYPREQKNNQADAELAASPSVAESSTEQLPASAAEEWARLPPDAPVVVMASALIPSKGVANAVRAVAKTPHACLVVAGDGPERQNVSALARSLLPGRHVLLGSIPRATMPAFFRRGNVFLHMSQDEPFGIVYLEAAASGLPVVAHDGAVPRWILGETAIFVDTNDLDAVAAAVERALQPAVKQHLGTRARQRVMADWTWQAQATKYRAFLLELLGNR